MGQIKQAKNQTKYLKYQVKKSLDRTLVSNYTIGSFIYLIQSYILLYQAQKVEIVRWDWILRWALDHLPPENRVGRLLIDQSASRRISKGYE